MRRYVEAYFWKWIRRATSCLGVDTDLRIEQITKLKAEENVGKRKFVI